MLSFNIEGAFAGGSDPKGVSQHRPKVATAGGIDPGAQKAGRLGLPPPGRRHPIIDVIVNWHRFLSFSSKSSGLDGDRAETSEAPVLQAAEEVEPDLHHVFAADVDGPQVRERGPHDLL